MIAGMYAARFRYIVLCALGDEGRRVGVRALAQSDLSISIVTGVRPKWKSKLPDSTEIRQHDDESADETLYVDKQLPSPTSRVSAS